MTIHDVIIIDDAEISNVIFKDNFFLNLNLNFLYYDSKSIDDIVITKQRLICFVVYNSNDLLKLFQFYNKNTFLLIIHADSSLNFESLEYAYTINITQGLEEAKIELQSILNYILNHTNVA